MHILRPDLQRHEPPLGLTQAELSEIAADSARLAALERYDVLDTPRDEAFDRVTRLARKLFKVPVAIVSFIDAHRQWYKSVDGLEATEVPLENTFCKQVLRSREPLVVADASRDPRFADHPLVIGNPNIRAYAGVPLKTDDGHVIGTLCIIDMVPRDFRPDQIEVMNELAGIAMEELELRHHSTTDGLTGALSRRAFTEEAGRATSLALRHHFDLSCIAIDLDHFKTINDTHGHAAGDLVLQRSVQAVMAQLRGTDLIGRLGGEEFAVLLPNTGLAGAVQVAEKLRAAVERMEIEFRGRPIHVTASFGVAGLDPTTRDLPTLLQRADEALYAAKANGRNRCVAKSQALGDPAKPRRRVLKGGQILFNGRTSSIDCTVRSLSEDGAGIDVISSVGIPKRFDLAIKADDFERPCRVLQQNGNRIDVAFC